MTAIDGFTSTSKFFEQFKGQLGEELIDVIAAAAGMTTAKANLDVHGIDRQIENAEDQRVLRVPAIGVQVKTSSSVRLFPDGSWHYSMTAAHFNHLASRPGRNAPRFLVLVPVTLEPEGWIKSWSNEGDMRLACPHAYWVNLMRRPRSTATTVTVHVPASQRLTPESLVGLFDYDPASGVSAR